MLTNYISVPQTVFRNDSMAFFFIFAHVIANKVVFFTVNSCNSAAPSAPPAGKDAFLACVRFLSGLKFLLVDGKTGFYTFKQFSASKIIYGA